jgi:hypothetical protein
MNFDEVLKTKTSEIERPPLIPIGTYRFAVAKYSQGEAGGNWDTINFQLQLIEPAGDDVDMEALQKFGNLKSAQLRHSFMFERGGEEGDIARTLFNLKRFLADTLKIENMENMAIKEACAQAQGRQGIVQVGMKVDKNDSEVWHNNIKKTAPLE